MSTPMDKKQKIKDLREFLARPRTSDETHPPNIPPELSDLPGQVYLDLALEYIHSYPFARTHAVITRSGRKRSKFEPTPEWQDKARACLTACVNVDRSSLGAIADLDQSALAESPYNAELAQQQFVRIVVFKRRWELEEVVSEMLALVELFRSETKNASSVPATPTTPDNSRDRSIAEDVRDRDLKCRMTGISREKNTYTDEEEQQRISGKVMTAPLEAAHGLPFAMGKTSFDLVTALTGVQCNWKADCVENAILVHTVIHKLFGSWKLYLEWTSDQQEVIIRARPPPASPMSTLAGIGNARRQFCDLPGVLIDQPLQPRHDDKINDIDPKYFVLHKFIGDIVWMYGGAEPISKDEEDDDDEEMCCVTEDNVDVLMDRLNAPDMDFLPRERKGVFGTRMVLVPKDEVWL
ncbi:hypothetical protein C8R44DRAFT_800588 [Mycena epipterygia]|nr:hypothetical protein C8R44DRAFT_800588 [Mycena epipterygia]